MLVFEYKCSECGAFFEQKQVVDAELLCLFCGSEKVEQSREGNFKSKSESCGTCDGCSGCH